MAQVKQDILYGAITSCRLGYFAFTAGSTTELASLKRFDATVTDTGEDFVATSAITPTYAEIPEAEAAEQTLRGQTVVITAEKVVTKYKAADAASVSSSDSYDTVAFTINPSNEQELKLLDLMRNQIPVVLAYPEMKTASSGAVEAYDYIVGRITSCAPSEEDYKTLEVTITGSNTYTAAAAFLYSSFNTAMEFASADFYSWGDDNTETGSTADGLGDADDLTALLTGQITKIINA